MDNCNQTAFLAWPPSKPFTGKNRFHMTAYSEFMPPPRLAMNPCTGELDPSVIDPASPFRWRVSEVQELCELRPGMELVAKTIVEAVGAAIEGRSWKGLSKSDLEANPYWPGEPLSDPKELSLLLPLALSRTQDDKGRVRWTLFGASHLGPDAAFWKSFFKLDGSEKPAEEGTGFLRAFAGLASPSQAPLSSLLAEGFRILPRAGEPDEADWPPPKLPSWARELAMTETDLAEGKVKTLLTFRRFATLPESVKKAAREKRIRLLPSPETMAVWNRAISSKLELGLPRASQIPLLMLFRRHEGAGLRIPQSGLLHEGRHEDAPESALFQSVYRRSSRQDKLLRHMDILQFEGREAPLAKALFSSAPEDTGLYDKPMARNCQIWNSSFMPVLDGPSARPGELLCAKSAILKGGVFGYRFHFPAMRVGEFEVFWHRPLAAVASASFKEPKLLLDEAPKGVFTAEAEGELVELEPAIDARPERVALAKMILSGPAKPHRREAAESALRVLEAVEAVGPLPEKTAARVALLPDDNVNALAETILKTSESGERASTIVNALSKAMDGSRARESFHSLTFHRTARREFELAYWSCIRQLSSGDFVNKNNADCVGDGPSQLVRKGDERGLDLLGDHLLARHRQAVKKSGVAGAFAGEIPFVWEGVYNFDWQGGWHDNRLGRKVERDLITVIPGRDRSKAVILADHYDTAFMEDVFSKDSGARIAAAGADDNLSATAALLLGAPIFLELAKEGKLACDVWLVHLTGEEFPADCMGARKLAQLLVERRLAAMLADGSRIDLSKTSVKALYVMDMIAHNNEHEPDVFQISPGSWPSAVKAALHLHRANEHWNALVPEMNAMEKRSGLSRAKRSKTADAPIAGPFLKLEGQLRLHNSKRSSLYNTDGQVFSDAGLPAVLIMENYDINRAGYHDTHDTMENIDLDFGSAVAAIAIEATAQAANA